jgi:hypothetical protein
MYSVLPLWRLFVVKFLEGDVCGGPLPFCWKVHSFLWRLGTFVLYKVEATTLPLLLPDAGGGLHSYRGLEDYVTFDLEISLPFRYCLDGSPVSPGLLFFWRKWLCRCCVPIFFIVLLVVLLIDIFRRYYC